MSDNKNNFKINDILSDIDFDEIGNTIKDSVNATIRSFTKSKNRNENLPQTKNKEVCAQKPPEINKAQGWRAISIVTAIGLIILTIFAFATFIDWRGFGHFLFFILSALATFVVPYLSWRVSKEYFRLTNNYVRFLRELGNNTVISIRDLASSVAQSEEKTVSDLIKMMKRGYFYQARIVEDDSLFILDIPTFKLYKEKSKESIQTKTVNKDEDEVLVEDLSFERAKEIINQGKNSLDRIKLSQDRINDANFRTNIDKLIKNSVDILNIVEKYPDKSYALNKFSDYYLPTAAKLVETYNDFEMMRTNDKKILTSMNQINESILTIAEAFDKIKVELLSDRAMDVKTDIDTINLLLNQEGYAEDDWES